MGGMVGAYTQLEQRLDAALGGQRFQTAVRAANTAVTREQQITNHYTQAAIIELIDLLRPCEALEIGTYFADTTRQVAETLHAAGAGHLWTIDPFGGHRIPGMLAQWPAELQSRVTFTDDNSMSHFLKLEVARTGVGAQAPYNLVFVDGHHSFEYALFDLLRSALYLRPGGVIVVDNVYQAGPAEAVRTFIQRYRHWKIYRAPGFSPAPGDPPEFFSGADGALLLAPDGLEIGPSPFKINLHGLEQTRVDTIRIPVLNTDIEGLFTTTLNLYSKPLDHHLTGTGLTSSVRTWSQSVRGVNDGWIVLPLPDPASITRATPDSGIYAELEFSIIAQDGPEHVLIDPKRPIALM